MIVLNFMEKYAFEQLGEVIWKDDPQAAVYPLVAKKFSLDAEEAKNVTDKAFDRWVEVYFPD